MIALCGHRWFYFGSYDLVVKRDAQRVFSASSACIAVDASLALRSHKFLRRCRLTKLPSVWAALSCLWQLAHGKFEN